MKKKIVRPPKQIRSARAARGIKNVPSSAVRSAPNLTALLVPIDNINLNFPSQNRTDRSKTATLTTSTGDGEEIPMRAIYYCSPRVIKNQIKIEKTQSFERCKPADIAKLFFQKCRNCCGFCCFYDDDIDKEIKELKLDCLKQLYAAATQPCLSKFLNNDCMVSLSHMISLNIFRPVCHVALDQPTDYAVDLEWEHLNVVYNLFISLLNSSLYHISQMQLHNYVRNFFIMFLMPDKREQQSIGRCLNEICHKFEESRPYIIAKCSSFLTAAQYDYSTQNSLPKFLEFYLNSISFLKPKNTHTFARTHLLPLIMLTEFQNFHATLLQILEVFINRDSSLVDLYLMYLMNHWPITCPIRQTLFLNAVHDIVSKFYQQISLSTAKRLLDRISNTFNDCTADISQQSLFMLMDDGMTNLILTKGIDSIHNIYIRLLEVCENHWLAATRNFAFDTLAHLKQCLPQLSTVNIVELKMTLSQNEEVDRRNWETIKQMAANDGSTVIMVPNEIPKIKIRPPCEHSINSFRAFKKMHAMPL